MEALDDDEKRAVAQEILGDADEWTKSERGPNGPWAYQSLTVKRYANNIYVDDVDGARSATIKVSALPDGDEAAEELIDRLDDINRKTLHHKL